MKTDDTIVPAQHDHPDGASKGWDAQDMRDILDGRSVATVTIADGMQTADNVEDL